MAEDWFIKIDGIDGESAASKHQGEIDVESFSWGVSHAAGGGAGGGGPPGKASFQDLHFVARISKASPQLFLSCATGTHHKEASLTGFKSGGKGGSDFLKYRLSDVRVTSVQHADSEGASPVEQVSLSYSKFELTVHPETGGPPVHAGFDVKLGKKF